MKIKHKLILSYLAIVVFSIVLVATPIFVSQVKQLESDLKTNSEAQLEKAKMSIDAFFTPPSKIVRDVEPYINAQGFNRDDAVREFQELIDDNPSSSWIPKRYSPVRATSSRTSGITTL